MPRFSNEVPHQLRPHCVPVYGSSLGQHKACFLTTRSEATYFRLIHHGHCFFSCCQFSTSVSLTSSSKTHTDLHNTPVYAVLYEGDSVERLNGCSDFISWNTNTKSVQPFNTNDRRPHRALTWAGPYLLQPMFFQGRVSDKGTRFPTILNSVNNRGGKVYIQSAVGKIITCLE